MSGGGEARLAVGTCALGTIGLAATSAGLAAVMLGDDADAVLAPLGARFPEARRVEAGGELGAWLDLVSARTRVPGPAPVPLDLRGTPFQLRVWRALTEIPAGTTVSYAELARCVGHPGAARAVGSACAANPIAILVPCHRVVRADGTLGGYGPGQARKRALLACEAAWRAAQGRPVAG